MIYKVTKSIKNQGV